MRPLLCSGEIRSLSRDGEAVTRLIAMLEYPELSTGGKSPY
jgi:hypothetical protein